MASQRQIQSSDKKTEQVSIPPHSTEAEQAVLGGIMLLLFGTIASVGIQNLIQHHVDLNKTRNILIISITLTTGLGGAIFSFGNFSMSGIGLSAIVGVFLNLVLPLDKEKATE